MIAVNEVVMNEAVSDTTSISFYLVYATIAVGLVVFLARTLHRNGAVFLRDVFDDADMAAAVNQLLVVGFYLLNMGYALMLYKLEPEYFNLTVAFNELVSRIGLLVLSLGAIHLVNMLIFWKIRNHSTAEVVPMPTPTMNMPPPPPVGSPVGL